MLRRRTFANGTRPAGAGSEAVTGAVSAYTEGDLDLDFELPAEVSGGTSKAPKQRQAKLGWKCPECGWSTGQVKYWVQKKLKHIDNFHPDLKAELNLKTKSLALVPYNRDTCVWRCPVAGCGLGISATETDPEARLRARKHHGDTYHPDEPKELFLLERGTVEGAKKATTAKLAAGVAKRLHQLKAAKAGDHDVTFVKLPPALSGGETSRGKKRNPRNFCTRALCRRCKRMAQNVAELGSKPCKAHSAGARRPALIARLTAALQAGGLDDLVKRDVEYLLELLCGGHGGHEHRARPRGDGVALGRPQLRGALRLQWL